MSKTPDNKASRGWALAALLACIALLVAAGLFVLGQQRYALALINWAALEFGEVELLWAAT